MVIFSAVRGTVIDYGQPVAGATIERELNWAWGNETKTDRVVSDAAGRFSLPKIEPRSLLGSILPHEPSIRQTILIHAGGATHKAWMFDKGKYGANGELHRPVVLTCPLDREPQRQGDVYGNCDIE